jgi:proliferating cell nuclear antigen
MTLVEAKTVQTGAFRTLIEALKCILVEMNFTFDKDGIRMIAMDNTRTVLVHMRLAASQFEKYSCSSESLVVGLNTDHLYRIVKTATNDDTMTLQIDKNDSNHLKVILENGVKKQITKYSLSLLDRDEPHIEMPDSDFPARITMPSVDFQKMCRDMTLLSAKTVEIKSVGSSMIFGCKGQFATRTTVMGDSENEMFSIQKDSKDQIISGVFSLPHLVLFTKCTNLSNNLDLYMKNDWFLMIKYVIANLGEIKLCLMPCTSTATVA